MLQSGEPCTHALVVGVSAYDFLPPGAAPAGAVTFGLLQLRSAAASAWSFAKWLDERYANASAPLGTIRLLLAPSEDEKAAIPELAAVGDRPPTAQAVEEALNAWKADCSTRPENVAVLYAAGHGIVLTKDEGGIVLLRDFAAPNLPMLRNSLDVASITRGLAGPTAPSRQFYFVDACQVRPDEVAGFQALRGGVGLDEPVEAPTNSSAIYTSAAPGTLALGAPGRGTLFSQALIECLDCFGTMADDDGHWVVTDTSLVGPLKARVTELAAEHGVEQTATAGGRMGPAVLHDLVEPPTLEVSFAVLPDEAGPVSFGSLQDQLGQVVVDTSPLHPQLVTPVRAGVYTLNVVIQPETQPFKAAQMSCFVKPPRPKPIVVSVT